jgi:glycogen debranching enzyme
VGSSRTRSPQYAGHALAAGLVPATHARAVADRLMAHDLFSGWGIRTLSSDHPSYNPLAYHLGAVRPVENATIALGFKRYGLNVHADRLITAMFAAADRFRHRRLPEALGGHP